MPPVSVIMPVYNSEKYLQESIESILNQTFKDFEFIIINDGSTDKSLAIINSYNKQDNRIKLITRINKGLVYSLNEALKVSQGTFIARMDSDDISLPRRFETQLKYMHNNPDVDLLATCIEVFGTANGLQKKRRLKNYNTVIKDNDLEKTLLRDNVICHPSVMIRKDSIIKLPEIYREKRKYNQDYDLWVRMLKEGMTIRKLKEVLLKYRLHVDSKSIKGNIDHKLTKTKIRIRLDYFNEKFYSKNSNILIWGAGNGGVLVKNIIDNYYPNYNIVGYIDPFITDSFLEGITIDKPERINSLTFDYIFIATTPGKEQAENFLVSQNLKPLDDFIWLV